MKITTIAASLAAAAAGLGASGAARAAENSDGITASAYVTLDFIGATSGGSEHRLREVDKSGFVFDWRKNGFSGVVHIMNTSGAQPNNDVGSLQGVDNNESPSRRLRLFEAWGQHDLFGGKAALKGGLIDLNGDGEFQVTGASGLLMGPEFGVTSELAASGPGGPSAYPITGLTLQLDLRGDHDLYGRVAVSNAELGTLGDQDGINFDFASGSLVMVEGGYEKDRVKLAIGGWRYTQDRDDLIDTVGGAPVQRPAFGGYVLAQHPVFGTDEANSGTAFFRAGVSDGDTGVFNGSWALGLTIENLGGKADRALSIAVDQAFLSSKYRTLAGPLGRTESRIEATYSQELFGLTVQPDVQLILDPGGDKSAKNVVVLGLRVTKTFGGD